MPGHWGSNKGPAASIYAAIMELGPQNYSKDGLWGPNSIVVVYVYIYIYIYVY